MRRRSILARTRARKGCGSRGVSNLEGCARHLTQGDAEHLPWVQLVLWGLSLVLKTTTVILAFGQNDDSWGCARMTSKKRQRQMRGFFPFPFTTFRVRVRMTTRGGYAQGQGQNDNFGKMTLFLDREMENKRWQ